LGAYAPWWDGRRINKPGIRAWVVGPERGLVRDGPQKRLTGVAAGGELGTGWVPLDSFVGKITNVPGGGGCIDSFSVQHVDAAGKPDGISTVTFKSFEQGVEKMSSESVDVIWIDERCSSEIYSELLARTTATGGLVFMTYTPLKGGGELTYRFLNEYYSPDRAEVRLDLVDAKHISEERRTTLEEEYLPHERSARLHGIPQLGISKVFPVELDTLLRDFVSEMEIKPWAKWICGIDFGGSLHPFACCVCAWVPDLEEFYVVNGFKMMGEDPHYHVKRIAGACKGLRIPCAYGHDGNIHARGSSNAGDTTAAVYRRHGAPMMGRHATNSDGKNIHIEPEILDMIYAMKSGKFVIASHMMELAEEFLHYHRTEDGKINPIKDDLISAMRYAWMCRHQGRMLGECDEYGRAPGTGSGAEYDPRPRLLLPKRPVERMARNVDFDLFE
jgi:phage terminase large subunit-like protein